MVNKINVTRSSMPPFEEYINEIKDLWESRWLTNSGTKHEQFQSELETHLGVSYVTLFTNGHLALENALTALSLPKGGEVITTPFTFASTTHAVVRCGLVPVFCDINENDYTIDASKIEELITDKTVAILPVHVYGNLCDVDKIQAIADKHNLKIIYDAAHAFGVTCDGVSAAAFGDAAMFSFHATKVFHSVEGGAVCCKDENLAKKLDSLKNFGISGPDEYGYVGGNAKMSEFHAAMGLCNLRHLNDEIEKRQTAVNRYVERLSDVSGIKLCTPKSEIKSNYAYFPVVFDGYKYTRDEIFDRLQREGITARKYFYPLTNSFDCYKDLPTAGENKTPVAKYIAERVLTLPLYADLETQDVDKICDIILK